MKIRKDRYEGRDILKFMSNKKGNIDSQHPQVIKELQRTEGEKEFNCPQCQEQYPAYHRHDEQSGICDDCWERNNNP